MNLNGIGSRGSFTIECGRVFVQAPMMYPDDEEWASDDTDDDTRPQVPKQVVEDNNSRVHTPVLRILLASSMTWRHNSVQVNIRDFLAKRTVAYNYPPLSKK